MWILGLILSILFCWPLALFVHEASHVFVMYTNYYDLKCTGFLPYPHWYSSKTHKDRVWRPWELMKRPEGFDTFYYAGYRAEGAWPRGKGELLHIAPLVSNCVLAGVGMIHLVLTPSIFAAVFTCAFLVDAAVWLEGYFKGKGPHLDGYRYRYGMDPDQLRDE